MSLFQLPPCMELAFHLGPLIVQLQSSAHSDMTCQHQTRLHGKLPTPHTKLPHLNAHSQVGDQVEFWLVLLPH